MSLCWTLDPQPPKKPAPPTLDSHLPRCLAPTLWCHCRCAHWPKLDGVTLRPLSADPVGDTGSPLKLLGLNPGGSLTLLSTAAA
jgi:hypothetical protein